MTMLDELCKVHEAIAERPNASTVAVITGAKLGNDYFTTVASALLTLGNIHAPLQQTDLLLDMPYPFTFMYDALRKGYKIPGWGSSFVKGEEDPVFDNLKKMIRENNPILLEKIEEISERLSVKTNTRLYPNASCYTIATLIALGYKNVVGCNDRATKAANILISSRINVWRKLYATNYEQGCRSEVG
jgi:citrate synthase